VPTPGSCYRSSTPKPNGSSSDKTSIPNPCRRAEFGYALQLAGAGQLDDLHLGNNVLKLADDGQGLPSFRIEQLAKAHNRWPKDPIAPNGPVQMTAQSGSLRRGHLQAQSICDDPYARTAQ